MSLRISAIDFAPLAVDSATAAIASFILFSIASAVASAAKEILSQSSAVRPAKVSTSSSSALMAISAASCVARDASCSANAVTIACCASISPCTALSCASFANFAAVIAS